MWPLYFDMKNLNFLYSWSCFFCYSFLLMLLKLYFFQFFQKIWWLRVTMLSFPFIFVKFCKEIGSLFALLFSIFSSKWLFVTSKWQNVVFLFCSYYFHFQNTWYYSMALTLIHQAFIDLNWSMSILCCEGNRVSTHNFISLCKTLKAKFEEWCGNIFNDFCWFRI